MLASGCAAPAAALLPIVNPGEASLPMAVEIRPFHRRDRDQVTALVNLHVGAVLPGVTLSVNTVLSQLEREPSETIVDPWVAERRGLVALDRHAVVAAALLHRYRSDADVGEGYRGGGEIRWLLCHRDGGVAGAQLLQACLAAFEQWGVTGVHADGRLPALGCYGVPDTWPHIRHLYTAARFRPSRTETVVVARCRDLLRPLGAERSVRRSVGVLGTRLDLLGGERPLGFVEVDAADLDMARSTSATSWADVGNLAVATGLPRAEVIPELLSVAARWLLLGGVERLVDYLADDVDVPGYAAILTGAGFEALVTTERGWHASRRDMG